jgi:alpha-tubulin suppressor-like RCC1 family protein
VLGRGSFEDSNTPVPVSELSGAVDLDLGLDHACAVLEGGTLTCWGSNNHGQLAQPLVMTAASGPWSVAQLTKVAKVTTGYDHTCALLETGLVYCWGNGASGQLGNGESLVDQIEPKLVSGLANVIDVTSGNLHACALLSDGSVSCWGVGDYRIGTTTNLTYAPPTKLSSLENVAEVSTTGNHTCARTNAGDVFCWGNNSNAELGTAISSMYLTIPIQVARVSTAISVDAGYFFTCSVLSDKTINCWGRNVSGQLTP